MPDQIGHSNSLIRYQNWTWLIHILFWLVLFVVLLLAHYQFMGSLGYAIGPASINLTGLIILVYAHLGWLLPQYFSQKKYLQYVFGLLVLVISTATFRFFLGRYVVDHWDWPFNDIFNPVYFVSLCISGIILIFLSLPLRLVQNWIKKIELEKELKTHQLEAELRFLKAQVNPHFLFNALNNIYSLSFTASEKAPEMILKLSDMMSYMLYDCKNEKVPLSAEIEYVRRFMDLQQLKKDGEFNLAFDVKGEIGHIHLTPMLFIPFFENAFKHGNLEDTSKGWMKSHLEVVGKQLLFQIENSVSESPKQSLKGGVGLENIRERLKLLFPDKHNLLIVEENQTFLVKLALTID
ncbi:MAG: histidine kinase [Bacteroidota bacterium]